MKQHKKKSFKRLRYFFKKKIIRFFLEQRRKKFSNNSEDDKYLINDIPEFNLTEHSENNIQTLESEEDEDNLKEIGREPGQLPDVSPFKNQGSAQFRVICYDENGYNLEEFSDIDRLSHYINYKGIVWVQMMGMEDIDIIHLIGALFEIPMLAQEDILTIWSRPKFEEYGNMILAIARAVRLSVEEVQGQQISFVAGANFLISFHEKKELVFENIERRIAENSGKIRKWGTAYLLYTLLDTLVDRILRLADEIEDDISDLEDATVREDFDGDTDGEDIREIYRLKRVVVRLGRMIYPLRDMVLRFERHDHPLLPPEMNLFFRDLYDHTVRSFDRIEHSRIILQELQDFYHTEHERRTSEVIRVLTVVTSIFIPLTFVAGIYGMNFEWIPELKWKYGYPALLIAMILFACGAVYFFKKRKWF